MTHTLEQLKAILDAGGTITNGTDEISKPIPTDEKYVIKEFYCNSFRWEWITKHINTPSDWQELKKDVEYAPHTTFYAQDRPYAPCMVAIDAREWDEIQRELEALRNLIG